MQEVDLAEEIRIVMRREGTSQASLARSASVSQATVSRVLTGQRPPIRQGAARQRLLIYMQQRGDAIRTPSAAAEAVVTAFNRVWDGSEAHAVALAKIIKATEDLRPMASEGELPR